jgi:hypothetical protein
MSPHTSVQTAAMERRALFTGMIAAPQLAGASPGSSARPQSDGVTAWRSVRGGEERELIFRQKNVRIAYGTRMKNYFRTILVSVVVLATSYATAAAPTSRCIDNSECMDAAMTKSIDAARHGHYAEASFGLLAELGVGAAEQIRDPDVFDQWSQVWSAMTNEPFPNAGKTTYSHVTPADIAALKVAETRPAIAEIVARAKQTRVVILDEDHLSPRDRAFGLEVARALRPLGYSVLAAEALTRDKDDGVSLGKMIQLSKDGYVRQSSGYYLNDPVFADFFRQSMRMGYRPVSYESAGFTDEKTDEARSDRREQEQAENIVHRALGPDPSTKVLIYGGRHHAAKAPINDPKVKERLWMAERLKHLTGIEPLVIDQVELGETPADRPDVNLYAIASAKAKTGSVVLMNGSQALVVGLLAGAVDLQVVHPPLKRIGGRPAWLESMGRTPSNISPTLLPSKGTRLIQAFLADEGTDAIPIDQVLVTPGKATPKLMLPKRRVRYEYQDDPRSTASSKE